MAKVQYKGYCFLPLYVFCDKKLLVSYLRPSNQDGAKHAWAILSLLVKRLRQQWPAVRIIFRGDSGFCRHKMFSWCERKNVNYIVGLPKNKRLLKESQGLVTQAEQVYQVTQEKQRLFSEVYYAAESWHKPRRVIVKAEHTHQGDNTRFVVTNLTGDSQHLYDTVYCARGEMENRIKEQQLDLFADRTSCHEWWANQFRLLLSSSAYILISTMRRVALSGTQLAQAQCNTIRLKLFKIGGVIIRNTRRIKFLLSSSYPYQDFFMTIAAKLCSG
jgi:Transposase DDE domain group 1